jgi:hypothetical protein
MLCDIVEGNEKILIQPKDLEAELIIEFGNLYKVKHILEALKTKQLLNLTKSNTGIPVYQIEVPKIAELLPERKMADAIKIYNQKLPVLLREEKKETKEYLKQMARAKTEPGAEK